MLNNWGMSLIKITFRNTPPNCGFYWFHQTAKAPKLYQYSTNYQLWRVIFAWKMCHILLGISCAWWKFNIFHLFCYILFLSGRQTPPFPYNSYNTSYFLFVFWVELFPRVSFWLWAPQIPGAILCGGGLKVERKHRVAINWKSGRLEKKSDPGNSRGQFLKLRL